jgi:hypothetical protein
MDEAAFPGKSDFEDLILEGQILYGSRSKVLARENFQYSRK